MKKVLFVTGTRADYGKLKPLAESLQIRDYLVSFWVTGMHVMEDFGLTKHEVYKDNYGATDEFINQKTGDLQSVVIAKTITAFTDYLIEKSPDLVESMETGWRLGMHICRHQLYQSVTC